MRDAWWETRRPGEATTDYLARVLGELGVPQEMVERARRGEFDDFKCPTTLPWAGRELHQLVDELRAWLSARMSQDGTEEEAKKERERVAELIGAVVAGEFDATAEEGEAWQRSTEGKAAFDALFRSMGGDAT